MQYFYIVTTSTAISHKVFLEKLHATLSAATDRALFHAFQFPEVAPGGTGGLSGQNFGLL